MYKTTELFIEELKNREIAFTYDHYIDEKDSSNDCDIINIQQRLDNVPYVSIDLYFYEEYFIDARCFPLCQVTDETKLFPILMKINELNYKYGFIKFVIDDEKGISVYMYNKMMYTDTDYANRCIGVLGFLYDVIDEAYPELMKVLWN